MVTAIPLTQALLPDLYPAHQQSRSAGMKGVNCMRRTPSIQVQRELPATGLATGAGAGLSFASLGFELTLGILNILA